MGGWEELEGLRVEYFEFFQQWGYALYHRVGVEQEPGPRITNLQLLQSNRASRPQNKGGQQDVDVQLGLVSAE